MVGNYFCYLGVPEENRELDFTAQDQHQAAGSP